MNHKPAWIQASGSNALWHSGSSWVFGSSGSIGSGSGGIFSNDNADCPQNVSTWQIYQSSGNINVPASDVSFECYEFKGNKSVMKKKLSY